MKNYKTKELLKAVKGFENNEEVVLDDLTYHPGTNPYSFHEAVKSYPIKHGIKQITVPLNKHQNYIGNRDLDVMQHAGFTVGDGTILYFTLDHQTPRVGCIVFPINPLINSPIYLKGAELITIHFTHKT